MTAPFTGEPTPYQKLAANLKYLRSQGASRQRIQEEIDRFQAKMDEINAGERRLSGVEKVAATGSKMASGLTFGLFDEAMGAVGGRDAMDTQRFLQQQMQEEHPVVGTAAEVAGSLATPGTFLRPAARTAGVLAKAGRVVGEGAIQGGLSALGNAEGSLAERADEAAQGATLGGATAGAIGGVVRGVGAIARGAGRATKTVAPKLEEIADAMPDQDIADARQRLFDLQQSRLADETMVADVLPQGEGALRQAATTNRSVRKQVDSELRERMNRLSNKADDRFSEYTGTQRVSGDRARAERLKKAQDEARPLYEQSRNEAGSYDASAAPDFVMPEVLNRPRIKAAVRRVIADDPERFGGDVFANPKLSHDVLDQAYKDMGEDIRYLQDKVRAKTATASERRQVRRMIRDREQLKRAIAVRSPSYPQALDKYAGEIAHRDAYDLGSRNTPADMIPETMASLDPATVPDFKQATAERLRANVPNRDIGEFARFQDVLKPIATRDAAETFKATYGEEAYRKYVKDLLEMAGLQRMKAGGGESTTVDKLMEQVQADPEAIVGMVRSLASGSPVEAIRQMGRGFSGATIDRLRNSRQGQENADFLMQRGGDKVRAALDYIERLRKEGKLPRRRSVTARRDATRALGVTVEGRPDMDLIAALLAREVGARTGSP